MAETVSVDVTVTNRNGSKQTELYIDPEQLDGLSEVGVTDLIVSAEAAGAWSDSAKNQDPFFGGDLSISAINDIRGVESFDEGKMEWLDDVEASIFETKQPVCVVTEQCAQRFHTELGGYIDAAVYAIRRNSMGITYELIEDSSFQVIGKYHKADSAAGPEMYITTGWMREAAEAKGSFFSYSSAVCRLEDPRELNKFKASLPKLGFMQPFEDANNLIRGDAIVVDDEMYIKTSQNLERNLETLKSFLMPFCLLIVGLVTMLTFLALRSSRRDMAIASSLGQPKWQTALSNFSSTLLIYLAGCGAIVPATVLLAKMSLYGSFLICCIFMLCASLGVALSLTMLLRFDTLALLTKTD